MSKTSAKGRIITQKRTGKSVESYRGDGMQARGRIVALTADTSPALKTPGNVQTFAISGDAAWNSDVVYVKDCDGTCGTVSLGRFQPSATLYVQQFGFQIPSGATITSIKVIAKVKAETAGYVFTANVQLEPGGFNAFDPALPTWGTSLADWTYPLSPADYLWGKSSWSPAEINDPNFGVYFQCENKKTTRKTASVDCIKVEVTFT